MIPKIIHYCWFGGKPLTDQVKEYIKTWEKNLPDFEIKRWDESNFDVNDILYTRQAYFAKKYAFVSDVARLYALVNEGGLYLDTDILIKKPFPDEWFDFNGFGSFEHDTFVQTGIIASSKNNPILKEFLESYNERRFFTGLNYDLTTNVNVFTRLLESKGLILNNTEQDVTGFKIFEQEILCGKDWIKGRYDNDKTYAVHDYSGSWGKDILKSLLKSRIEMAITILRWKLNRK